MLLVHVIVNVFSILQCEGYFIPMCKGNSEKQGQYKMTYSLEDMLEVCAYYVTMISLKLCS